MSSDAAPRLATYDDLLQLPEDGVPHFWLVDPAERVLESFELSDGLGFAGEATTTAPPRA